MSSRSDNKVVSVVIPVWNEAEIVDELVNRLAGLHYAGVTFEIIFVNDGSTDATGPMISARLEDLPVSKLIQLSRNFGQQPAFRAGLEAATGDAVVFMDGDLQDPPETIPALVRAWQDGAKVVVACRRSRQERGPRRWLFDAFHSVFFRLTDGAMPKNSGTFGLMDRVVADHVNALSEVSLFLPALRCWPGYQQTLIEYDRQARFGGKPKQSFSRLIAYAWDGIVSFSETPLRWITILGLSMSALGFSYALILVIQRLLQFWGYFTELEVMGFTTIVVAILCMGGIQLIALGVIGEYLARIFREVKRRPVFIVESVRQHEQPANDATPEAEPEVVEAAH